MEDFRDFLFGYYWEPNEHIPRGFALITAIFKKKSSPYIYIYTYRLYVKKYIFVAGGGAWFFFGDHWGPNEAIPTGFAHITFFHRNPPNNFIF